MSNKKNARSKAWVLEVHFVSGDALKKVEQLVKAVRSMLNILKFGDEDIFLAELTYGEDDDVTDRYKGHLD